MSRSKHTDPKAIRSARRLRAPQEKRGAGDLSVRRQQGRWRKEMGVPPETQEMQPAAASLRAEPRVTVRPARAGFHHPAGKAEILEALRAAGPIALYGLRSVELRRAPAGRAENMFAFGSYQVPGKIVLYEQGLPPWRLPGLAAPAAMRRLKRVGAVVTRLPDAAATLVEWPEDTLPRFMLEQVLMHEIGHHVLQQHKGKRPARIARTRDHEAFAELFVEKRRVTPANRGGRQE